MDAFFNELTQSNSISKATETLKSLLRKRKLECCDSINKNTSNINITENDSYVELKKEADEIVKLQKKLEILEKMIKKGK